MTAAASRCMSTHPRQRHEATSVDKGENVLLSSHGQVR